MVRLSGDFVAQRAECLRSIREVLSLSHIQAIVFHIYIISTFYVLHIFSNLYLLVLPFLFDEMMFKMLLQLCKYDYVKRNMLILKIEMC